MSTTPEASPAPSTPDQNGDQSMSKTIEWNPESWRNLIAKQQPIYTDQAKLDDVLGRLATLPPLVTSWEIENLKKNLADAAEGKLFVIQGGDCSENLDECSTESIVRNLKVLMQMSLVLMYRSMKPVVRIGRVAGQYAKPRSKDTETRDGVTLPVYRGDIINRSGFTEQERMADPDLLMKGYERSALTLNFIRALCAGGFADLHHPENWDLGYFSTSTESNRYQELVHSIGEALQFMETVANASISQLESVDLFTSHEGLHLTYEQSLTRQVPRRGRLVQPKHAFSLDWGSHSRFGWCSHRIFSGHQKSDRFKSWTDNENR